MIKNIIIALLILPAIIILAGTGYTVIAEEDRPTIDSMEYEVIIATSPAQPVKVKLRIFRLPETRDTAYTLLSLYQGQVNVSDFRVFRSDGEETKYFNRGGRINVPLPEDYIDVEYNVILGKSAKHGLQGVQVEGTVMFSGGQVLFMPFQKEVKKVTIKFTYPRGWEAIIPGARSRKIQTKNTGWFENYEVLKNCYAFGKFKKEQVKHKKGKLCIWFPEGVLAPEGQEALVNKSSAIYKYFLELFNTRKGKYHLVLLGKTGEGKKVFCGAGSGSIGFTLEDTVYRDWQLLGHRLTHAFLDSILRYRELHFPPNLWLLEAMTSYYETAALNEKDFGRKPVESYADLFRRYLYSRIMHPDLVAVKPGKEALIKLNAEREYLHYTLAPLVLYAMEELLGERPGNTGKDHLLNWCIANRADPESFVNILRDFNESLNGDLTMFKKQYINGTQILPLWDAFNGLEEDPERIKAEFEYHDNVLDSWYKTDSLHFERHDFSLENLEARAAEAEAKGIHFSDAGLEEKIKKFSPMLYKYLMVHTMQNK